MIQLPNNISPSQKCLDELAAFQDEIDKLTYSEQQKCIEMEWRNKSRRVIFTEVKNKLTEMCQGAKRCSYCEDSAADEIEHFLPKNLYPNKAFVWENYLYACGTCNGPKQNSIALFSDDDNSYKEIKASEKLLIGEVVLINPREENGMDFMMLDLIDTFEFVEISEVDSRAYQKCQYSIRILHLNDREYLRQARKNAYSNYKSRLTAYIYKRDIDKANLDELESVKAELKKEGHKTVWEEMKRQHQHIPELKALFDKIPDALTW
ncbi:MAG: aminoglycoside phosphotransferase [Bacteroidia bacterium]